MMLDHPDLKNNKGQNMQLLRTFLTINSQFGMDVGGFLSFPMNNKRALQLTAQKPAFMKSPSSKLHSRE